MSTPAGNPAKYPPLPRGASPAFRRYGPQAMPSNKSKWSKYQWNCSKASSATVTVSDSINLWVSRRILEQEIVQKTKSNRYHLYYRSLEMVVFTYGLKRTMRYYI